MDKQPKALLLIPRIKIINANCISGPSTWGFPAVSAFTGAVHAVSRMLKGDVALDGAGVVCHDFDPLVYKGSRGYEYRFSLTRNPIYDRDTSKPSGIVEEGRAHMTVSILTAVYGDIGDDLASQVQTLFMKMRLAGGSVAAESVVNPEIIALSGYEDGDMEIFRKLRRKLLPGFALVDRSSFLEEHLADMRNRNSDATALDALMDIAAMKHSPEIDESGRVSWRTYREGSGWLVPIPIGYSAISEVFDPGRVANTRDRETPFCFVESAYSVGEWINPLRLKNFEDILWFHKAEPENGYYLCGHKKIYN